MSRAAQIFYAEKFYPHLLLKYAVACVQVSLKRNRINFEPFEL